MNKKILIYRNCPLCDSKIAQLKYKRNYDLNELKGDENLFSARRERKKKAYEHNTFLQCSDCDMIYANPIINPSIVEKLYNQSKFNYSDEQKNIQRSYGSLLKIAEKYIKNKGNLLDIGAGNGFFMLEALNQGYNQVQGIEPSKHAVVLADSRVKKNIINDILRPNQLKKDYFDAISIFQTIDHIENPNEILSICNKALKKDGLMLVISHDVESFSARFMGEKSPIFDIEHTQLFSRKTISKILEKNGFKVLEIVNISNTYALEYWIKLSPVPKLIKTFLKKIFDFTGLSSMQITIKPGNFGIIARKI